jgi:hypothetical protein
MLAADHLVELGCRPPLTLLQRMHIHPKGQAAAVGVAELGGDVGSRHPGRGQERRGRVAQGMQVDLGWQAGRLGQAAEL